MAATEDQHPHLSQRRALGVGLISEEKLGFNGQLAVLITRGVGSMWCAYIFAAIALISLPEAIHLGIFAIITWISQTFLQLVLLSVIMVGQQVLARASDRQALQTYRDAEAILELTDEIDRLIKANNRLTEEIHRLVVGRATDPSAAEA